MQTLSINQLHSLVSRLISSAELRNYNNGQTEITITRLNLTIWIVDNEYNLLDKNGIYKRFTFDTVKDVLDYIGAFIKPVKTNIKALYRLLSEYFECQTGDNFRYVYVSYLHVQIFVDTTGNFIVKDSNDLEHVFLTPSQVLNYLFTLVKHGVELKNLLLPYFDGIPLTVAKLDSLDGSGVKFVLPLIDNVGVVSDDYQEVIYIIWNGKEYKIETVFSDDIVLYDFIDVLTYIFSTYQKELTLIENNDILHINGFKISKEQIKAAKWEYIGMLDGILQYDTKLKDIYDNDIFVSMSKQPNDKNINYTAMKI